MFWTPGFIFKKTVVRTGTLQFVYMQGYKQYCRWKSTEHTLPPTRLHVYMLYFTCTYSSLPGGEPSGSKNVDDIVKIKILV
jgi:hypothetical protein